MANQDAKCIPGVLNVRFKKGVDTKTIEQVIDEFELAIKEWNRFVDYQLIVHVPTGEEESWSKKVSGHKLVEFAEPIRKLKGWRSERS